MKDLEANDSPTSKEPYRPLKTGGEQREDTRRELVGMPGTEVKVTPGDLALFQSCVIMRLNNETYAA